ncbi:MAG TPA: phosphonate ABC transporter, permease protein PhnE, partial [Anaerolineales bacterium]|nr:phosphonate ABC transporter, permease protein PhnE [Anaerolineales bacterium]
YRGIAILLGFLVMLATVYWYGNPLWYFSPVAIWLWNIWDAASARPRSAFIPVLFALLAAYSIGWRVVQIDFSNADMNRAIAILRPMAHPDFVQERREQNEIWVDIQVPCHDTPPSGTNTIDGKTATVIPACAGVRETVILSASGLWPNADANIWWEDPSGQDKMIAPGEASMLVVRTDGEGKLTTTFTVPTTALIAVPDPEASGPHRVFVRQYRPIGGIELSFVGGKVLQGAVDTVGMALLATVLAIIIAVPISFLAAHNLMSATPITYAIYVVMRTLLNILRSIESLIIAIVFVVIVGLGPFAGVLALAVHSVAALAKLYSEVIEGIDPGPIEAIRASGANWLQTVRYAVIPQIIPPFTAFTIYRWDINVRSATIVGFVGGGGLGFLLIELIRINDMRGVSAVFIAIALIVMSMDYLSAKVRERLV